FVFTSLLIYSFRHTLYLHSFPTRRSSDLRDSIARRKALSDSAWLTAFASIWNWPRKATGHQPTNSVCAVQEVNRPERFFDFAERDRKSTRLNSSHVKISYAVFCLKKKK